MSLWITKIGILCGSAVLCVHLIFLPKIYAQSSGTGSGAAQTNQQNLEAVRKRGFVYLQAGNWEAARTQFEIALGLDSKDTLSIYGSSLALFNLRKYPEAANSLQLAVEILFASKENNQLLADSLVLSAVISAVQNENAVAIEKLERAIKLIPNHFDANFSLGRAYFGNGEIDKSVNSFRQAVLIKPTDVRSRFFLATALERAGTIGEALAEYRKVLELEPNSADGNLGLGVLLIKTEGDKSEEGLKALQKAVAVNPDLYEAQVTLGKTLVRMNRAAEAIEHLQKGAELGPNNPEPHFQLAIAYRKLGRKAEAEAENAIVKKIHEIRRGVSTQKPR